MDRRAGRKIRERSESGRTRDADRGRRNRVVLTPRRWRQVRGVASAQPGLDKTYPRMTVAKEPGHRGEHDISCKTIACGNAGRSGVLVVTRVRSTNTKCTRGCGCSGHPAFRTPSLGRKINAPLGRIAPRGANVCLELTVIAIYRILRECYGAPAGPAELWLGPRRSMKPGRVAMRTRPGSEVVSQDSRQFLTTTAIAIAAAVTVG